MTGSYKANIPDGVCSSHHEILALMSLDSWKLVRGGTGWHLVSPPREKDKKKIVLLVPENQMRESIKSGFLVIKPFHAELDPRV